VSRYETAIDLENPNNSQTQLITLVGHDKVVLDVGCAAGDTAEVLARRGCTVSGVDIDAEAAEPARAVLEELVIANIDLDPLSQHFAAGSFDAIIFGDVLEHLVDPWAALRDAATLLRPGGRILVSIPNVAHASIRLALLTGRWDYTDKGLLDRTHLRFFTQDSVVDLLESAGLVVEELRSTVLDPMSVQEIELDASVVPPTVIEWARHQPGAMDYQYVAAARVLEPGEQRGRRPRLVPTVAYDAARTRDRWTEEVLEVQDERHRVLTQRDHILGLEAKAASEAERSVTNLRRAKQAERRFRLVRNELEDVVQRLEAIAEQRRPQGAIADLLPRLRKQLRAVGTRKQAEGSAAGKGDESSEAGDADE
jgi:2-polyprenyl-3-methyl-5-hydroxy-6-metoxy-1,4-benzoquinol methylase